MSQSLSTISDLIIKLSKPLRKALSDIPYNPPPESISVEAVLHRFLPEKPSGPNFGVADEGLVRGLMRDFALGCALLSSARSSDHDLLSWIPESLASSAELAFHELSEAYSMAFGEENARTVGKLGLDCGIVPQEKRLVVELMPELIPSLKDTIKESSVDKSDEVDEFSAASARTPVGLSILAAYQFRWFVSQIGHPPLGKLCSLVIPCALTALDHWSPEVKGQGMLSLIHIGKNVNANDLGWYGDAILDACCQNIASSDEIWHLVVEMSVLFVTSIQQSNPRSAWYERILNEMLSHLERQPRNKDRYVVWLQHIETVFSSLGLLLLAHFRRIFPLFFQWMQADDDETVRLVLKQVYTIIRLTWIRNTPYIDRLVDELAGLYKRASSKKSGEDIRELVSQILVVLHRCKGSQFEAAFDKHRDDLNLTKNLLPSKVE